MVPNFTYYSLSHTRLSITVYFFSICTHTHTCVCVCVYFLSATQKCGEYKQIDGFVYLSSCQRFLCSAEYTHSHTHTHTCLSGESVSYICVCVSFCILWPCAWEETKTLHSVPFYFLGRGHRYSTLILAEIKDKERKKDTENSLFLNYLFNKTLI